MNIHEIRNKARFEEIDYVFLKDALREYREPRSKIKSMLKKQELIRVKKGLYIFGKVAARELYSKEHLANLIYGPSLVSLEYALQHYGLIPERVYTVTSITTKRTKSFATPIGNFSYQHIDLLRYRIGATRIELEERGVLIATPAKALLDLIFLNKIIFKTKTDISNYLWHDIRINESNLVPIVDDIISLGPQYNYLSINFFIKYLREIIHA